MTNPPDLTVQASALRSARTSARMSQRHLAAAAGVSDRTVRRAESGLPVTDEVVRALCSVLGLDVRAVAAPSIAMPDMAPNLSRRRDLHDYELRQRWFLHCMSRPCGGLHPILFFVMLFTMLWFKGPSLALFLAFATAMYLFSRKCGATRRQAILFLRGHAFADGEPVDIIARVEFAMRENASRAAA